MCKKISFFFGAGAEGDRNYYLPTGPEYKTCIMSAKTERGEYLDSLKAYFDGQYYGSAYRYRRQSFLFNHDIKKLDEYFCTIINPKKYGRDKFSIVFNYYWTCYFVILEAILRFFIKNKIKSDVFQQYFQGEKLDYNKVLESLPTLTKLLYEIDLNKVQSKTYYSCIKQKLKDEQQYSCEGVLTTNYYRFCEGIFKESETKRIAYLNGQMKNFEFPEALEIVDFTELHGAFKMQYLKEKLFFPFIFGQSYVKPIVHQEQIKEYYKAHQILEKVDVLIMIGFNINEDDNHINAYLHEYMLKKNKKILFVHNQDDEEQQIENIRERLKLTDTKGILSCKVDYQDDMDKIVEDIFKHISN